MAMQTHVESGVGNFGEIAIEYVQKVLAQEVREIVRPAHLVPPIFAWTEQFDSTTYPNPISNKNVVKFYSESETANLIEEECHALCHAASDPDRHLEALDRRFSLLIKSKLEFPVEYTESIVTRAFSTLKRLPMTPSELPDNLDGIPHAYFAESGVKRWDRLRASLHPQESLVRFALSLALLELCVSVDGTPDVQHSKKVLDGTARLIECSARITDGDQLSDRDKTLWVIVRSYLWSFWQRLKMIRQYTYFYTFRIGDGLSLGGGQIYFAQRNFTVAPGLSLVDFTKRISQIDKPGNTCSWTLELLRNEPYCLGMDFSLLHRRYSSVLGGQPARCRPEPDQARPCDGKHPKHCLRFHGAVIGNQTAHDSRCQFSGRLEPKLRWNEASYRAIQGPRAVKISRAVSDSGLEFCRASRATMAISHVWSHGQGGRPEEGINQCLHERYCDIASRLGCDSYWMDTTCIPKDHQLRAEAISQINDVFYCSKAVLVCDQDIMKIETENLSDSLPLKESLLAATLLSDWNTRAWTLLESMKGRQNIYILCKNRVPVDFSRLARQILNNGRIDLAIFTWHVYQLLPEKPVHQVEMDQRQRWQDRSTDMSFTEIGSLLSYRPASREGDDIVIWSLLASPDKRPTSQPRKLWRDQMSQGVPTGYLMSSAERLRTRGLSWALKTPYATNRDSGRAEEPFYRAQPYGTRLATMREDGLWGKWWTYEMAPRLKSFSFTNNETPSETEKVLDKIKSRFLRFYEHGILLVPITEEDSMSFGMLLTPESRQQSGGVLVAVCGSNKRKTGEFVYGHESFKWTWKGVYEWPSGIMLPKFEYRMGYDEFIWIA